MDLETRRQLIHMSGIAVALYVRWAHDRYGYAFALLTLALVTLLGYAIAWTYKKGHRLPAISKLIDITERPGVIEDDPGRGALSFFIGSLLTLLLFGFNVSIVSASILILALGDSTSTLVGRGFGRHKLSYNPEKSWEGTAGGFFLALLGSSILLGDLRLAFIGSMAGMLFESLPLKLDDNIGIPLSAGAAMALAFYLQS